MPAQLRDVGFPLLTVAILSPVAILCFRYGVPIELIVFGLLCAGYNAPRWFKQRQQIADDSEGSEPSSPTSPVSEVVRDQGEGGTAANASKGLVAWRPWRSSAVHRGEKDKTNNNSDERSSSSLSWRKNTSGADKKGRSAAKAEAAKPKSGIAFLKKNASQTQWRSIINKFTPEKFDKLCQQLLDTLPSPPDSITASATAAGAGEGEKSSCCDEEFGKILDDLLSMIFDCCSRQHQYTEMYTDLCRRILEAVAKQRPDLDGRARVWQRCQFIFHNNVLKTPEIPADLPEDEYMDRKAKNKEKMVGMVKFGGDLVGRGLVPPEGVMTWIHTLLSEKVQEVYSADEEGTADSAEVQELEKDDEQREVQLEVLCAILASMGSSLSDSNTWSDENRQVIEDVFEQLEQLSTDAERLSLRIRCLIRDVLDLKMAEWKEKAGKLKPTALHERRHEEEDLDTNLRRDAPEFVPGEGKLWTSDRVPETKPWMDPQLIAALRIVEHHLEVIESKDAKLARLKSIAQLYHFIQEKQIVIVANAGNLRLIIDILNESFKQGTFACCEQTTSEHARVNSLKSFQTGQLRILVLSSDVAARRDFEFGKAAPVLVNFDFPMTLQLYLFRIQKRASSSSQVYTFFGPHDVRHASSLNIVLEAAEHKVPPALLKLREQAAADSAASSKKDSGGRRGGGKPSAGAETEDGATSKSSGRQRTERWDGAREHRRSDGPEGESGSASSRKAGAVPARGHAEERSAHATESTAKGSGRAHAQTFGGEPRKEGRWSELEGSGVQRTNTSSSMTSQSTPSHGGARHRRVEGNGRVGAGADAERPVRILSRADKQSSPFTPAGR